MGGVGASSKEIPDAVGEANTSMEDSRREPTKGGNDKQKNIIIIVLAVVLVANFLLQIFL